MAKVLVIDDEEMIHKIVKRILGTESLEVVQALNGLQALEMLESERPDLILLDINMPVMDGYEVMKQIRADDRWSGIPVFMLSGNGEMVDRVVGFELGVEDYVAKPFQADDLVRRIQKAIKSN